MVNPFKILLDCRGFFRKELGQPSLAAEHPSAEEGQQEDSVLFWDLSQEHEYTPGQQEQRRSNPGEGGGGDAVCDQQGEKTDPGEMEEIGKGDLRRFHELAFPAKEGLLERTARNNHKYFVLGPILCIFARLVRDLKIN